MAVDRRPSTQPLPVHRRPARRSADLRVGATLPGRLLQATWLAYVGLGLWGAAFGPDHPEPSAGWRPILGLLGAAVLAVTAGLVRRRRWALLLSVGLSLPMVALAVWCAVIDPGSHWLVEAALAGGVLAGSFHPAAWRMHRR